MVAGNKLRKYTPNLEREVDMSGLRVTGPVDDRFSAAADYQNYGLLKKLSFCDHDVAQKLRKMVK